MIRTLLIWLLCAGSAAAQAQDDRRVRIELQGGYDFPVGAFHRGSDHYLFGQMRNGAGGGIGYSQMIAPGWLIGLSVNYAHFTGDGPSLYQNLETHYRDTGFYTTVLQSRLSLNVGQIGFKGAYSFTVAPGFELEPYLMLALGWVAAEPELSVYRKQKGDNFAETVYSNVYGATVFFYPSVGCKGYQRIFKVLYLTEGLSLNAGSASIMVSEDHESIFNTKGGLSASYSQPVVTIGAMLGLQFRIGRYGAPKQRHAWSTL